ncbi:MAG: hypothetical protein ACYDHH_21690 [Solirubrobacteraceae bacterium]
MAGAALPAGATTWSVCVQTSVYEIPGKVSSPLLSALMKCDPGSCC